MRTATTVTWLPRALALLILPFLAVTLVSAQDGRALWTDVAPESIEPVGERGTEPLAFRALSLDFDGLREHLAGTRLEDRPGDLAGGRLITLPLPDGTFATYRIVESPVMAPGLQSRYPDIRTYLGQDIDQPRATLRISVTPHGFHAISSRREGTLYIDPLSQFDRHHVRSYWRHDMPERDPSRWPGDEIIEFEDYPHDDEPIEGRDADLRFDHGDVLRIYRAAIAANRHYTTFHSAGSPTVAEGLAAIVTAVNRLNSIFERDFTSRLVLVENNDKIIYTSSANDPYSNSPNSANINTNQSNLNSVIGAANYDIGHLLITGGGGLAGVGVVCNNINKARAVSGLSSPVNDPFVVDIFAHEIGHQFGAWHSFNGSAGSCSGNYTAIDSMEPGSGSTIMSYSGLCITHNLQGNSDDYYHNISLQRILNFILTGGGGSCAEEVPTGNDIPTPILPQQYSIPILTPFVLNGDVEYDGDPEMLTFSWEGMSSSAQGPPPGAAGWDDAAPYFRSFSPVDTPTRFFPTRLNNYVVNPVPGPAPQFRGEGLPGSTRIIPFRLTVRNNAPGGGSISHRQLSVHVNGNRGPFVVTSHSSSQSFLGHEQTTVTWDVANTNVSAVGGENVDILLSLDRAHDLIDGTAIVLAAGVPNDGAHTVSIPAGLNTTRARIFVKASDGYFFGFNSADLTILPQVSSEEDGQPAHASLSPVYPNPLGVTGSRGVVNLQVNRAQTVRVVVFDALGREVAVLHDGPVAAGSNYQLTIQPRSLAAGTYYVRAVGDDFTLVSPMSIVR